MEAISVLVSGIINSVNGISGSGLGALAIILALVVVVKKNEAVIDRRIRA